MINQNTKNMFFNDFKKKDMDNAFEVQKLAIKFRKWAEWNKSKVIIDVLQSYDLHTIVITHNLFDEVKIVDSWGFLNDIINLLSSYADTQERWEDMITFWR